MTRTVNLLPPTVLRRQLLRRRTRQWAVAWLGAFIVALAVVAVRHQETAQAGAVPLDAEQRQQERLAAARQQLAAIRARLAASRELESRLFDVLPASHELSLLGMVSRCAQQASGPLRLEQMSLAMLPAATATHRSPSRSSHNGEGVLTLRGVATDPLTVAGFVAGLRDTGVFSAVERRSPPATDADESTLVFFWIEGRFWR
jgi:hypothetical protein